MWCDQAKSVWSRSNSVFLFLTNCMHHFHSYILQKTPLKSVNCFQRYEQLKDAKNNGKQKTFSALVWLYLKINISDFRLILLDHITFVDYTNKKFLAPTTFQIPCQLCSSIFSPKRLAEVCWSKSHKVLIFLSLSPVPPKYHFYLPLKALATIPYFNFYFFPHLLIFLQFWDPSYVINLSTKAVLQKWHN